MAYIFEIGVILMPEPVSVQPVQTYQPGDFVYDDHREYGLIFEKNNKHLYNPSDTFEVLGCDKGEWTESRLFIPDLTPSHKKISPTEFLDYLRGISNQFERNANDVGGIRAAIEMRRKFNIDQTMAAIEAGGDPAQLHESLQNRLEQGTQTGIYVAAGPNEHGYSQYNTRKVAYGFHSLSCVAINPSLPRKKAEGLLTAIFPKGFGSLVKEVTILPSYKVFEIPEEGLKYCPDRKSLEEIASITISAP